MLNRVSDYLPVAWSATRKPRPTPETSDLTVAPVPISSWTQSVSQLVKKHPGASLAAALCVGVTIAWWIKRR